MFQQFQKSQFSKSSFCKYFMFKGFINFLDSHKVFFVFCCNNNAVCSLSNYIKQMSTHINDFVFIVDLESLFRDGSCFPLCIMVSVWFVHIDDVLSKFTHFTTKYYISIQYLELIYHPSCHGFDVRIQENFYSNCFHSNC